MWFVSRKKYNAMVAERDKWESIAAEARESAEQAIKIADKFEAVAISCQEENKRILKQQKEMVDAMRKVEVELTETKRKCTVLRRDYEVLMNDYEILDAEYGKIEEERDHYEERCRYLEGEVEDKEELEVKLSRTTEHIQLADGAIFAIEDALYRQKGDNVIQLHIDEYYEEVKLLDTK